MMFIELVAKDLKHRHKRRYPRLRFLLNAIVAPLRWHHGKMVAHDEVLVMDTALKIQALAQGCCRGLEPDLAHNLKFLVEPLFRQAFLTTLL